MKILIVSQYFWPENFRINDLAVELLKKGYEVTVLTGKPNYPQGRFYEGYSFFGNSKDSFHGVRIIRIPVIPRGDGKGLMLAINYLSFVFFSCLYILLRPRKFDVTFTFAISPITQVFPALLHKWIYKSKTVLWIQDLWPESVSAAGKMNSKFVLNLLTGMVKLIYKRTDKILVSSKAFISSIESKGIDTDKISYLPNWSEDIFTDGLNVNSDKYSEIIPKGFVVMFAGNIGEAQDFDSILKAADLTKDFPDIKWVIVGDGRKKKWVEDEIENKGLSSTVLLPGRFPSKEMPALFSYADVTLVTLKDTEIFGLTIPSKIQAYMAFGKPIITMLNGIGSQIIKDAGCGFTSTAGDYKTLANNVIEASKLPKEALQEYGHNAKQYYNSNFSKDKIISDLDHILNEVHASQ